MLNADHLQELRDFLRDAREAAGMTQAELAERVGVSRATIGQLENGLLKFPKLTMLAAIAVALDVSPGMMLAAAGLKPEDATPVQIEWIVSQLDREGLELFAELGHGLVRVRQRQQEMAPQPAARRSASRP